MRDRREGGEAEKERKKKEWGEERVGERRGVERQERGERRE